MSKNKDATENLGSSGGSVELLPCPFCGGEAGFCPDNSYGACYIGCNDEDCVVFHRAFDVWELGLRIDQWNTRRVLGLVNWLDAEIKKSGEVTYSNPKCQALEQCRKMVKRLLGQ